MIFKCCTGTDAEKVFHHTMSCYKSPPGERCEVRIRLLLAACRFRIPGSDSDCQDPIRKTDL